MVNKDQRKELNTMMIKTDPTYIKGEKGFTLIEIIGVLVILGFLASVAIPKFIDLQEDGRQAVAQNAIAETKSRLSMAYGKYLLKHGKKPINIGRLSNRRHGLGDNSILPIRRRGGVVPMGNDFRVILDKFTTYGRITVTHVQGKQLDTPVVGRWDLPS